MTITPLRQSRSPLTPVFDIELFQVQQARLRQYGKLHWVHWLIMSLSIVITIFAWQTSHNALKERNSTLFLNESERVINQLLDRLKHYEDGLLSGVAAIQVRGANITRNEWRRYAHFLNLPERYPGISGIGVVEYLATEEVPGFLAAIRKEIPDFNIHPSHVYDVSLPVIYIEPESSNKGVLGLDAASETSRRLAALRARSQGKTQISGPVMLQKEGIATLGFLFYAPFYRQSTLNKSEDYFRNDALIEGLVFAPLIIEDLVAGALRLKNRKVSLKIYDNDTVLVDETAGKSNDFPQFQRSEKVLLYGRTWTFELSSDSISEDVPGSDQPELVLISGLALDIMLLVILMTMNRSNRSIFKLADEMTEGLSRQALALSESNRDLESFAHVVSHDLKAPIRNIADLTEFLEEDLSGYLASNDSNHEISEYLDGLRKQVTKSQSLISGILEYSVLGLSDEPESELDTKELLLSIGQDLNLHDGQLVLEGDFPRLYTRAVLLSQVLTKLIGNGIKYNQYSDTAKVTVSVEKQSGRYFFSVTDNGPGIEQRFHKRIFKPFTTLETGFDIHSSGIGLSIVQRAVELQGGEISVDSQVGHGTTFTFSWPELSEEYNVGVSAQHV